MKGLFCTFESGTRFLLGLLCGTVLLPGLGQSVPQGFGLWQGGGSLVCGSECGLCIGQSTGGTL